jgi:hypothetical protein
MPSGHFDLRRQVEVRCAPRSETPKQVFELDGRRCSCLESRLSDRARLPLGRARSVPQPRGVLRPVMVRVPADLAGTLTWPALAASAGTCPPSGKAEKE